LNNEDSPISNGVSFEAQLAKARALIQKQAFTEAEEAVSLLQRETKLPRFAAYLSHVKGELAYAMGWASKHKQSLVDSCADQALRSLDKASELAQKCSLRVRLPESPRVSTVG
jgi:hypothetical protein